MVVMVAAGGGGYCYGGRCYEEWDERESFVDMVKCHLCTKRDRWFSSEMAYLQHWNLLQKTG